MNEQEKKNIREAKIKEHETAIYMETLALAEFDAVLAAMAEVPETVREQFKREYETHRDGCIGRLALAQTKLKALQSILAV